MRAVVSYPGVMPAATQVARAFHERDMLARYETTFVYDPDGRAARALRQVPHALRRSDAEEQLLRRALPEIPASLIRTRPAWDLLRTAATRLRMGERIADRIWMREIRAFDQAVARGLGRADHAVYAYEQGCCATFERARTLGLHTIFDMAAPHHTFVERVWKEHLQSLVRDRHAEDLAATRFSATRNARKERELQLAQLVVANSSFTAKTLLDSGYPSERVRVVPLGAPPIDAQWRNLPRPAHTRFLFAGNASLQKGAHVLLDAFGRLTHRREATLTFAGTWLLDSSSRGSLPPGVALLGNLPRAELYAQYRHASVLVVPSLYDGFGMVVTEALAHGLPVIVTDRTGACDLIEEGVNGWVVPAADAAALRERLAYCAEHPEALWAMREAAEASAGAHGWEHYRSRLIQTIRDFFA